MRCSIPIIVSFCLGGQAVLASQTDRTDAKEAPASQPASPASFTGKVTLKWTTASEMENYGFNIHRGESADGPWTKVNEEFIPGAGTSGTPHSYQYVDLAVTQGKTYFYWLEAVSLSGHAERMSQNTIKIVAKGRDEPPPRKEEAPATQPSPSP